MRLFLSFALAALAGCSHPPPATPLYPVAGRLVIGGVPAANAQVAFHPVGVGSLSVAHTDAEGRFRLTTRAANDGAAAGEYVVTFFWPNHEGMCDDFAHDRMNGAYLDRAKSPLRATVRPESNDIVIQASITAGGWNLPRTRDLSPERK